MQVGKKAQKARTGEGATSSASVNTVAVIHAFLQKNLFIYDAVK